MSATGVATFSSAGLAVGSHSLTAQYMASTDFKASTSSALAHKVVRAGTKTSLQVSPNPAKKGQVVTLIAHVTPKYFGTLAGTVTFKNGTQILGTATIVSNQATFTTSTLAVGTHSLTAAYGGNAQFNKSTSAVVKEVIQ